MSPAILVVRSRVQVTDDLTEIHGRGTDHWRAIVVGTRVTAWASGRGLARRRVRLRLGGRCGLIANSQNALQLVLWPF